MARTFDPASMAMRGRIGAFRLHATHDPRETTAKARQTFADSFAKEVDPDGTLSPEERDRRAVAAKRAHYASLAFKSARARARKSLPPAA